MVANWLPAKIERGKRKDKLTDRTEQEFSRRQYLQDLVSLFVERTDHRMNSTGSYAWKFKVQRIDPLTPRHETIRQAVSQLWIASENQGILDELDEWLSERINDWFETVKYQRKVVSRLSKLTKDCSETLASIFNDCLETLDLEDKDCFETLLKTLKYFKDSQKDKDTSSDQDSSILPTDNPYLQMVEAVTNAKGDWSLVKLLTRADKKNRQIILNQEKNAVPFVSWVIQGASQGSIQNPYSLAIAKLLVDPCVSAGGASDRLAALPSQQLASLIEHHLTLRSPTDHNWRMLFAQVNPDRIRLLADSLGLKLDIEEESRGS
jgi:hypothetical protein